MRNVRLFSILLDFVFSVSFLSAQEGVSINAAGDPPHSSAILDVSSDVRGILIPRMTEAQRDAISGPATGLLIYQTDNVSGFYVYNGSVWGALVPAQNDWALTGNSSINPATQFIGTTDATDVSIRTSNTDRIRVLANGNVGIRTLAPGSALDIGTGPGWDTGIRISGGATNSGFRLQRLSAREAAITYPATLSGTKGKLYFDVDGIGIRMTIESDGNVGIGTTDPTALLSVNGTANKTGGGSWSVYSDRRLKKDIQPFTDGLNVIEKINPVRFRYNGDGGIQSQESYIGVIAQDVQAVAPYMISPVQLKTNSEDEKQTEYLQFDPNALWYLCINAIKEQQAIIEEQEKLIARITQTHSQLNESYISLHDKVETLHESQVLLTEKINQLEMQVSANK